MSLWWTLEDVHVDRGGGSELWQLGLVLPRSPCPSPQTVIPIRRRHGVHGRLAWFDMGFQSSLPLSLSSHLALALPFIF